MAGHPNYGTITASTLGAKAATTGGWIKNPGCLGAIFTFHVTAHSTTTRPTFKVQGRVGGTTDAYTFATIATTASSGTGKVAILKVHPLLSTAGGVGSAGTTNTVGSPRKFVRDLLPAQFRVNSTNLGGAGTVTWECFVDFLP